MAANGPAGAVDDDFDDDELDDLPPETFAALERDAIAASQLTAPLQARPSTLGPHRTPADAFRVPPNGYGRPVQAVDDSRDEEQVINLDDYSHGQRPTYPPRRPNVPPKPARLPINRGYPQPLTGQAPPRPQEAPPPPTNQAHLQSKVQQLERELAALRDNASTAESRAQAKSGEAAILRQRLDKSTRDYEQKIEALRQAQAEAVAQHRTELDALRRDREKAETDRRFLEHDLAVEVGKTRQQSKPTAVAARMRTLPGHGRRPPLSPRKAAQSFGDGFDDHEVFVPSPSPSKKKGKGMASFDDDPLLRSPSRIRVVSKPTTPSDRPEKRRKRDGSPSVRHKLSFDEKPLDMSPPEVFSPYSADLALEDDLVDSKPDGKLEFLQNLVDMRVLPSNERLLDALSSHSLPSLPNKKLSSILLDQLTGSDSASGAECTTMFAMAICNLWTKCLHEKYYSSIDIFVDALHFVLISNTFSYLRTLVPLAVSPALKTVNLVAYPISEASYSEAHGIEPEPAPSLDTNLSACFDLLSDLATACAGSAEHVTAFWEIIDYHSALVFLAKEQPIHHVSFMCRLLSTSSTPASFGPIIQKADAIRDQSEIESLLVERLSSLLLQTPSPSSQSTPLDVADVLAFRLDVLSTLQAMSSPPRTGASITAHPAALGRLITFLHDTVDALYSTTTAPPATHAHAVACINAATLLLHALLTAHASAVDVREKLKLADSASGVGGGAAHMHLVALTRIAFCEAAVLERGIAPAASDAAHALLDEFLSPFEGEQLLLMYPTADSTAIRLHDGGEAGTGAGTEGDPMVLR
jgi:hypothetical protein